MHCLQERRWLAGVDFVSGVDHHVAFVLHQSRELDDLLLRQEAAGPAAEADAPLASGTRVRAYGSRMDDLMTTDACTLPTAQRPLRLAEFDRMFCENVRTVERDGATVRMHLTGPAGLRERVQDLAERESSCCSFFTFVVDGLDDDLVFEVSALPERRDVLEALAQRATELSA